MSEERVEPFKIELTRMEAEAILIGQMRAINRGEIPLPEFEDACKKLRKALWNAGAHELACDEYARP